MKFLTLINALLLCDNHSNPANCGYHTFIWFLVNIWLLEVLPHFVSLTQSTHHNMIILEYMHIHVKL